MPQKHHYIPVFYLKRWVSQQDGRLCVYSRWHSCVDVRRMHPGATGYVKDLYAIGGAGDAVANHLEGRFLSIADSVAAKALSLLETGRGAQLDEHLRSGWSRFVMTLFHRNPEAISKWMIKAAQAADQAAEDFRANYLDRRLPTDPEKYEDYPLKARGYYIARSVVPILQRLMDSQPIGLQFNRMAWVAAPMNSAYTLLTSDRPLMMTGGMAQPNFRLAMPMGPRRLFIAANEPKQAQELADQDHDKLVSMMNDNVSAQARRFVWGVDASQLRFVERRLGDMRPSSILDLTE
jgi:hypothetical protein